LLDQDGVSFPMGYGVWIDGIDYKANCVVKPETRMADADAQTHLFQRISEKFIRTPGTHREHFARVQEPSTNNAPVAKRVFPLRGYGNGVERISE
jgi:hypothetical protein